ncbi:hypothetical protein EVAR_50536_1 [Eumeta japonica]|uniref:BEN domain-containing protein n=1 Tax=Eumeta variegata TaxID=151549 RepID=A0A4C1YR57_EUMVA|nr:hypothetical protein EVAR_50536_1 [Eumeta japonica]
MQTGDRGISVFSNNKLPMSIQVASAVVQPQDIARRGAPEHVVPTPLLRPVLGNSRVFKVFGCQEEVRARVGRAHNGVALFVPRPRLLVGREAGGGGTEVPLKAKRRRTGIANLTANDIRLAEQCSRLIMATPIDMLILALEATQDQAGTFRCRHRFNAEVMILTLDHGVPRPAPTQAPPREALHPASAAVASDCSGETRAAEVVAPSDDRNTIEDHLPSLAKNGQNSRVNSETTNDLEPGDYSSSGSSWAPDQQSSSDSESEERLTTEPIRDRSRNYIEIAERCCPHGELGTNQENESEDRFKETSSKTECQTDRKFIDNYSELKEMGSYRCWNDTSTKRGLKSIGSHTMAAQTAWQCSLDATHSLTGKASPAFLSKPAKLSLDPEKVADIVMTVTANSHVKVWSGGPTFVRPQDSCRLIHRPTGAGAADYCRRVFISGVSRKMLILKYESADICRSQTNVNDIFTNYKLEPTAPAQRGAYTCLLPAASPAWTLNMFLYLTYRPFMISISILISIPICLTLDFDRGLAFNSEPGLGLSRLRLRSPALISDLGTVPYSDSEYALGSNFNSTLDSNHGSVLDSVLIRSAAVLVSLLLRKYDTAGRVGMSFSCWLTCPSSAQCATPRVVTGRRHRVVVTCGGDDG